MLSEAPRRVKIASTGVKRHAEAGTGAPICAKITAVLVALSSVDLPPYNSVSSSNPFIISQCVRYTMMKAMAHAICTSP